MPVEVLLFFFLMYVIIFKLKMSCYWNLIPFVDLRNYLILVVICIFVAGDSYKHTSQVSPLEILGVLCNISITIIFKHAK